MYISSATLIVFALAWWLHCHHLETQTPEYWTWRRELAIWKANRRRERHVWRCERPARRAARRDLRARHYAMARRIRQTSPWQSFWYLWHARQHEHHAPAFNRYVTLTEMRWDAKATGPPARLRSLTPGA